MPYQYGLVIGCMLVFLFLCALGFWIYGLPCFSKEKTPKKALFSRLAASGFPYDFRNVIAILLAAGTLTLLLSTVTFSKITNLLLFLGIAGVLPYVWLGEQRRKQNEAVFTEVILYAHNMAMLLKETGNVYLSLSRVVQDIAHPLRHEIELLLVAMEEDRQAAEKVMRQTEQKYRYSCIKNLNAILLYMYYEDSRLDEQVLNTFQDDIEELDRDVKENGLKRKTLRFQYVLITAGSIFAYWFLLSQLRDVFYGHLQTPAFQTVNALYLFVTLICLFFVDRYFNANITKE